LTAVFALATFVVLRVKFFDARITATNIGCLMLAALFPGQVYLHAAFPMSMCLFFTLLFVIGTASHSFYRGELRLLPCVVLLQRLPFPVFVPVLLAAIAQIGLISELFFTDILI
jgi:hypothetical protein